MCTTDSDGCILEAHASQEFSHIDDTKNNTGDEASNDREVLSNDTDEIGLLQKWSY